MPLVTDLLTSLATAKTDAATASTDAITKSNDAKTTPDAQPACTQGLAKLQDASKSALIAHDKAGEAQGIFDAIMMLNVLAILGNIPTAQQLQQALNDRDAAAKSASDATAAVDSAAPVVLAAHDACILSALIQPILDCVTDGITRVKAATETVTSPLGGAAKRLDQVVKDMIKAAASDPTYAPKAVENGCNAGVQLLADAVNLIAAQASLADMNKLGACIAELNAAAPGNALIAQGDAARLAAQNIVDAANALINDKTSADILSIWRQRVVCTMRKASVRVHISDESGDDFGDDNAKGASIEIVNFPYNQLLPVDLPKIPIALADEHGNAQISDVPLAPDPTFGLPANVPSAPPGLPANDFAMLHFTASHASVSGVGQTAVGVDHSGTAVNVVIQIQVPDTSPTS